MFGDSLEHSVENSDFNALLSSLQTTRNNEIIEKIAAIYIFYRMSRAVALAHGRTGVLENAFID